MQRQSKKSSETVNSKEFSFSDSRYKRCYQLRSSFLVAEHVSRLIESSTFNSNHYFIWESSEAKQGDRWKRARFSEVVLNPDLVLRLKDDCLSLNASHLEVENPDPLSLLESYFQRFCQVNEEAKTSLPCFGVLAYDSARFFEPSTGIRAKTSDPDLLTIFPGCFLRFDREKNKLSAFASEEEHSVIRQAVDSEQTEDYLGSFQFPEKAKSRFSKEEFVAKVERAKEYITAGDAFQIVLANSFTSRLEETDPLKAFSLLSSKNPSPFHYCANASSKTESWALVGASPELYLKGQQDQFISMRLVAGTYPRTEENDAQQKELLKEDPKERAEHFMLVDHARNDVGRSSEVGSVQPLDLLTVETYRDVHHLVSEVRGKPVVSLFESFKNCFPIATLTGTPKVRAMQIIEELEGSRGVFGGSVFRMACDGSLNSSVIIRSVVIEGDNARVNAGCGVVYDSDSKRENDECRWKAGALFGRRNDTPDR